MEQQCNISLCKYQEYGKDQGHEGIQRSYKKCAITSEQMSKDLPYLSTLEMCSRQGAIQIHIYLTLSHFHFRN